MDDTSVRMDEQGKSWTAEQPPSLPPADYELLGHEWPMDSPVLTKIPEECRPVELTICATCPLANWYLTIHRLKCYCSAMRILSWGGEELAVRACDHREMAIQKILEKAAEGD